MLEIEFKLCVYRATNNQFFAMKPVKICRFKASLVRIFARRTLFPFTYFNIHVKMRGLLTYSAIKWV